MNLSGCFSKKSDNWKTPKFLYEKFMEAGYFDPCPFNSDKDNLDMIFNKHLFINPPYSKIKEWTEFAIKNHEASNKNTVLLIPSRTDTKYFRKLYDYGCDFMFITGRLKFNDIGTAPFPSCLVFLNGGGIVNMLCVNQSELSKFILSSTLED